MELQNYACEGVAGRVGSWVCDIENKLASILEDGVVQYISENTDPYVLDNTSSSLFVCIEINPEDENLKRNKAFNRICVPFSRNFPAVPCIKGLEKSPLGVRGIGENYTSFPVSLFAERFKPCVELLIKLEECNAKYMMANQKTKKAIFQTLFSEDETELQEFLEDES